MTLQEYRAILQRYLPEAAVDEVMGFLNSHAVHLKFTTTRKSKLGDYRPPQRGQNYHAISVNGDMNRYLMLLVLLHEMAHLTAHEQYGRTIFPHGREWQEHYRKHLMHYMGLGAFPEEAENLLQSYTAKLPLRPSVGDAIEQMLHSYDERPQLTLDQLPEGSLFEIANRPGRLFKSLEKRRTRWMCQELATGSRYLVSGNAPVIKATER